MKEQENWLSKDTSSLTLATKRFRPAKHDAMEKALYLWFTAMKAKNIPISQDIIRNKAVQFGRELVVGEDFHYSQGWI